MINRTDKKKLSKDLEKGLSIKCFETNIELYKGWKYTVTDLTSNQALFASPKLEPAINFFNKYVQNHNKQKQKSLSGARVQK